MPLPFHQTATSTRFGVTVLGQAETEHFGFECDVQCSECWHIFEPVRGDCVVDEVMRYGVTYACICPACGDEVLWDWVRDHECGGMS